MGNYLDKGSHTFEEDAENLRVDLAFEPVEPIMDPEAPSLSTSTTIIEIAKEAGESIDYHIFSYKQHMPFKQRQIFRWAAAKLALTEELIRTNQLRSIQLHQSSYLDPETDYLSDDEMEEASIDRQLHSLEKYRTELVQLLGRLSLNSNNKSKRKKSKKFKRRKMSAKFVKNTIISDADNDSDMSDTTNTTSKMNANICRDKIVKRTPFKVKNC